MKTKALENIRTKTLEELSAMASDLRNQIAKATLERKSRKNKNTNIVRNLQKDLAQILTIKRQKELT